jgi:hypothetical protein
MQLLGRHKDIICNLHILVVEPIVVVEPQLSIRDQEEDGESSILGLITEVGNEFSCLFLVLVSTVKHCHMGIEHRSIYSVDIPSSKLLQQ